MNQLIVGILLTVGIGAGVSVAVSLFAKLLPKEKTYTDKIRPAIVSAATWLNNLLLLKVGKGNAEKIEEGIILTLVYWIENATRDFYSTLTKDNKNGSGDVG